MKTIHRALAAWLILLAVVPATSHAQTAGTLSLGARGEEAISLALNAHVEISGLVARVRISQTFLYQGNGPVEGVYQFPLPPDSAVDTLKITLGDRVIVGEIRERQKARHQYEEAREEGRRAALVEQAKANLFTTSVANIEPATPVKVEIAYQQTVAYAGGQFEIRVPFAVTPRYTPPGTESDPHPPLDENCECGRTPSDAAIDVRLNNAWAIADLSSPSHKLRIDTDGDAYRIAIHADSPRDGDFILRWSPLVDERVAASVYTERFEGEDYALLLLMPSLQPRMAAPRELIFVIDTSGSMQGASIEQAKMALVEAVAGLRPLDRFNVIQFNSETESLFAESVMAGPWPRGQAENYIRHLTARGGTEMAPALKAALQMPAPSGFLRQVVFVTDGAVGNEAELFKLIAGELGSARLFTVGIGAAPNQLFMERAARAGRGTASYIAATSEVAGRMATLFQRLSMPVLTDIQVEGNGRQVAVPDVYAGEPTVITLKLPVSTGVLNVTGFAEGASWGQQVAVGQSRDHAGVARLWARRRIAELMQSTVTGADPDTVRDQTVDLGLRFGLVTPHTSLVAVERTPHLEVGTRRQARVPTPAVAFPVTAIGIERRLAIILTLLVAALAVARIGRPA